MNFDLYFILLKCIHMYPKCIQNGYMVFSKKYKWKKI
jgi:hypothetical protein